MKLIDLTGKTFGNLIVIERDWEYQKKNNYKKPYWKCRCSCGKTISVLGKSLREGKQISCGCLAKQRAKQLNFKVMTYEENVRAILECCFSQSKDEIIDKAVSAIVAIKPEPVTIPVPVSPNSVELPYRPFVTPYYTDPNLSPNPLGPVITCNEKNTLGDSKNGNK